MSFVKLLRTAGLAAVVAAGVSSSAAGSAADVGRLVGQMSSDDAGARGRAEGELLKLCWRAGRPGAENERAAVCQAIAAKLGPGTPNGARVCLLRALAEVGGAECVPWVARLVGDTDEHVRDAARRVLETNPSPDAGRVLRAALVKAGSAELRAALASSIGARGDVESVGALAKLLGDRDETLAAAAADALGKIGGTEAAQALGGAYAKASGDFKARVADAYLACAEKLLADGMGDEAAGIYQELNTRSRSKLVKLAAFKGLAAAKAAGASARRAGTSARRSRAGRPGGGSASGQTGAKRKVRLGAYAKWDAKLRARIGKAVEAGKSPSFYFKWMRTKAKVTAVTASGALKVSGRGVALDVTWSRLSLAERKDIALSVAGDDAEGHAVAAFYLIAVGDNQKGQSHVKQAGDLAKDVEASFK